MLAQSASERFTRGGRLMVDAFAVQKAGVADSLLEVTQAAESHGDHGYWLLDRSALPLRWLSEKLNCQLWVDVLRGREAADRTAPTPVLIEASLDGQPDNRFTRFANEVHGVAAYANAVSFLTSPLKIDALQAALRSRARIELPQKLEVVLRYFDTRTLPLLPTLFTPMQYAAFVKDVTTWHYLDRRGELLCLPPAPLQQAGQLVAQAPWILDDAQEAMLIDDGLTDAAIDHLITQGLGDLLDLSPPEQFDKVDPVVMRARRQGVLEHTQVFEFVVDALNEVNG
jgi:hypothetical protein